MDFVVAEPNICREHSMYAVRSEIGGGFGDARLPLLNPEAQVELDQ